MAKFRLVSSALIILMLVAVPLFLNVPGDLRLLGELQNSGHAVLFGLIALVLRLTLFWSWQRTLVFCLVVGSAIEGVQYFTGGDCDPGDVYLDLVGALAGIAAAQFFLTKVAYWAILWALLGLLALYQPIKVGWLYWRFQQEFPVLCTFDEGGNRRLLELYEGIKVSIEPAPLAWTGNNTHVARLSFPSAGWPGISLVDLARDWSNRQVFEIDVWSPNPTPVSFNIALRSRQNHGDGHDLTRRFMVNPGFNTVSMSLADLKDFKFEGELLVTQVARVILFSSSPPEGTELFIDNLRLR